jgi:LysR family transcriptional regulator, glycine cleavage system transcriptional activator
MSSPDVRLPPLNALRVFHSVMRHRSFRNAANELFVTPQAVSQQIKLLEDNLAVTLFGRKGRMVDPTEQAVLLWHFVEAAFEELSEGVRRVTKSTYRNRINLNVSPYFATVYLIGRLDRFRDRVPGVDIRLTTMVDLPEFGRDEVDVAIQWGFGEASDYDCSLLVRDPKIICCAPVLAAQISKPEDLLRATLLHPTLAHSLWSRVLRHLGVEATDLANDIQFQDAATMRRATVSGLGCGLISVLDATEDLRAGRLVAPFGSDALASMNEADIPGFYLIAPRSHRRVASIAAFCDWAQSEDWEEELRRALASSKSS